MKPAFVRGVNLVGDGVSLAVGMNIPIHILNPQTFNLQVDEARNGVRWDAGRCTMCVECLSCLTNRPYGACASIF